jgi:hypothetical protein
VKGGFLVLFRAVSEYHGVTVKLVALSPLPPEVQTEIFPVSAPAGTVAVIWVSESTVKLVTFTLPKCTSITPMKLSPVITTLVLTGPLVGEKLVICGTTRNVLLLVSVPPGSVTMIEPVLAPAGTVAVR